MCACLGPYHVRNFFYWNGVLGLTPFPELLHTEPGDIEVRLKFVWFYCFQEVDMQCMIEFRHGIRREFSSRNGFHECRVSMGMTKKVTVTIKREMMDKRERK